MKSLLAALAAVLLAAAAFLYFRSSEPPAIATVRATRQRVESVITTNGKVEPIQWAAVRAERAGLVSAVPVTRGQRVAPGQTLAVTESREARADLDQALARIAQAQAEIDTLSAGGRTAEVAALDAESLQAKLSWEQAVRERETAIRLEARKAATRAEVQDWSDRIARLDQQLATLSARRAALVNPPDLRAAQGRLADAEAAARFARERLALGSLRAPMAGTLYHLAVRPGVYLEAGSEVASVGHIDRLRVVIFVDEPELGRVRAGMDATVTWDALPGRQWRGTVEKTPTQIVPLGTRQVGEVLCQIDNADSVLLPGTNVNVSLRSSLAENAVSLPKEAIQRRNQESGVYVINGGRLAWRPVRTGVASITRVEISEGLREGDSVAVPGAVPLAEGMAVRAAKP